MFLKRTLLLKGEGVEKERNKEEEKKWVKTMASFTSVRHHASRLDQNSGLVENQKNMVSNTTKTSSVTAKPVFSFDTAIIHAIIHDE